MCLAGIAEAVRPGMAPDRSEHRRQETAEGITRRGFLVGTVGVGVMALFPTGALAAVTGRRILSSPAGNGGVRDLTHVFREGFPVYTGDNPTRRTLVTIPENGFYQQEWTLPEHAGTHMDAPGHFVEGGRLSPAVDPRELMVPVVVVDISDRVRHRSADAVVRPKDLRRFEMEHGHIPHGAVVCMYSGWERRVHNQDAYRNLGADGKFHFPGFGVEAVEWLLEHRSITGIGVDTLSLDHGPSETFAVHHTLLGADRYGLENLANLGRIPPAGASIFVGLIPWEEGSGGPCRVIAHW